MTIGALQKILRLSNFQGRAIKSVGCLQGPFIWGVCVAGGGRGGGLGCCA